MAKKTTPRAKPRTNEPAPATPELDSTARPAAPRRRAAKPPAARASKAARTAHVQEAEAAATGSGAVHRPRKVSQLPTQATEQTQSPAPVPPADTVSDEEIRMRAYFLSLERGAHGGSDMEHWLQAERELRSKGKK